MIRIHGAETLAVQASKEPLLLTVTASGATISPLWAAKVSSSGSTDKRDVVKSLRFDEVAGPSQDAVAMLRNYSFGALKAHRGDQPCSI